jgi:hypothetical protein
VDEKKTSLTTVAVGSKDIIPVTGTPVVVLALD